MFSVVLMHTSMSALYIRVKFRFSHSIRAHNEVVRVGRDHFTPPAGTVNFPGQIGAQIMPASAHAVQNRAYGLHRQLWHTAELGAASRLRLQARRSTCS